MDQPSHPLKAFLQNQFKPRCLFSSCCLSRFSRHSFESGNPQPPSKPELFHSRGQALVEAVLSLLVLLSFLYLLQKLYEESDKSIQKARLSSKTSFKIPEGR